MMKYKFDGYNWFAVVKKGELLVENLLAFAKENKVKGAWVFAIGACDFAEFGAFNGKTKNYKFKQHNQQLEIVNIQGNLSWDGQEPIVHLHGTFADENGKTYGGHVKELRVSVTCEIFIHDWFGSDKIERKPDKSIGLNLLDL